MTAINQTSGPSYGYSTTRSNALNKPQGSDFGPVTEGRMTVENALAMISSGGNSNNQSSIKDFKAKIDSVIDQQVKAGKIGKDQGKELSDLLSKTLGLDSNGSADSSKVKAGDFSDIAKLLKDGLAEFGLTGYGSGLDAGSNKTGSGALMSGLLLNKSS